MRGRFLGAVQFLSVIPVRARTAPISQSAVFFPLVGALIGLCSAGVYAWLSAALPRALSSLLTLGWMVFITGALHEDAVADAGDAFRAGRAPEEILRILKDSRIGAFGACALAFSILIRWQAIAALPAPPAAHWIGAAALTASLALSRAATVALAGFVRPAGSGLGHAFIEPLTRGTLALVLAQCAAIGAAVAAAAGYRAGPVLLGGSGLIVWGMGAYFRRAIGGVTGDCLGAAGQAVECFCLLVFACAPSTW